jgi:hypothetical protein
MSRQMILGDVIEYIFAGRAYYYAAKSESNLKNFLKLILYTVADFNLKRNALRLVAARWRRAGI